MDIMAENVPAGIAWRRPCRNPDCDHDDGDTLHNHSASGNDFRTTHDMTRSHHM
jgi:hypothetical protein